MVEHRKKRAMGEETRLGPHPGLGWHMEWGQRRSWKMSGQGG